jgi:hypothetical protein
VPPANGVYWGPAFAVFYGWGWSFFSLHSNPFTYIGCAGDTNTIF